MLSCRCSPSPSSERRHSHALRLLSPHSRPHRHARGHPQAGARRRAARPALRDDRRPHRLPGGKRIALPLHARRQASRHRRCAGNLLHPGRGGGRHGEAAARHLRPGAALSQPGADGEDGGLARRPVGRPRHAGRRRRLAEGGVRGAGQSRLRAARGGDRRMDRDLQAAVEPLARELRRQVLQIQRHTLRAVSPAEAASADLGRRPFEGRVAAHGAARRRLAPGRRHRRLAAAAAGDAARTCRR